MYRRMGVLCVGSGVLTAVLLAGGSFGAFHSPAASTWPAATFHRSKECFVRVAGQVWFASEQWAADMSDGVSRSYAALKTVLSWDARGEALNLPVPTDQQSQDASAPDFQVAT